MTKPTRSHGPDRRSPPRPAWQRALALALVALLVAPPALANPSGGEIVAGSGEIVPGVDTTVIRADDGTIIEWQDFDIDVGHTVRFVQPDELSRVLNRVVTPDPTQIDGTLLSNGIVYILNPYGIYFGSTAVVDVGQLIAAGGDLTNEDFVAGIDRFTELGGHVENLGTIHAGKVGLFGASVANHGLISAPDGAIWLIAGDEVIVAEHHSPIVIRVGLPAPADEPPPAGYAVDNTGVLDAGRGTVRMAAGDLLSLAIRNQGTIRAGDIDVAGGENGRVQIEGTLDASSDEGVGGHVEIRGDTVALIDATVDVSGRDGGGTAHVGGGWQGERAPQERNARITYVNDGARILADATGGGDGGEIVVWSDGHAVVRGALSARGGSGGGDGGRVETSGKRWIDVTKAPDVRAVAGRSGEWWIDPADITIRDVLPGEDPDLDEDLSQEVSTAETNTLIVPITGSSYIDATTLAQALGNGTTLTITTEVLGTGIEEEGNITFETSLPFDAITSAQGTTATLVLQAANNIVTDPGVVFDDGDDLDLTLLFTAGDPNQPGGADAPEGTVRIGRVDVGGTVTLAGDRIELQDTLTAGSSFGDLTDPSTFFTVVLQSNRDGISTQGIEAVTGAITVRSFDEDPTSTATPGVVVGGPVTANEGGVAILAVGGDISVADVSACADCTLPVVDDLAPPAVSITAVASTDGAADPTVKQGTTTLGGAISAGTGDVEVSGQAIVAVGTITTQGGDVLLETAELDEDVTSSVGLDLDGDITTNGGSVSLTAAAGASIDATIDARGSANPDAEDSTIAIAAAEGLRLSQATASSLLAEASVTLISGSSSTGDLAFDATNTTTIEADEVAFSAGDEYTDAPGTTEQVQVIDDVDVPHARIDFGRTTPGDPARVQVSGTAGAALTRIQIAQDASIGADELPTLAELAVDATTTVNLRSNDGALRVDGATSDLLNAVGTGTLEAARRPEAGGSEAIALDAPVNTGSLQQLDVLVAGDLVVDPTLAGNVTGIDTLGILAGARATAAEPSDPPVDDEVLGNLTIQGDLTAGTDLTLHGGTGGLGDLVVDANLTADAITLRAGDGVGGVGTTSAVQLDGGSITADDFTLRQDGAIGGVATAIPAVVSRTVSATEPDRYELRSDDAGIVVEQSDAPALEDKALVLASRTLSMDGFDEANPLRVHSLDLGRIGAFTVTDADLAPFDLASDTGALLPAPRTLTLRAGIGLNGNLTIGNGTTVEGDEIRLVASDGAGGNVSGTILGANGTSVVYRKPVEPGSGDPVVAPDTFVFEQDADIVQSNLPSRDRFGDGTGSSLPTTTGIRSRGVVSLETLDTLPVTPGTGRLVIGGDGIVISNTAGFAFETTTELRSDAISLLALDSDEDTRPEILIDGNAVTFAAHETADGELDEDDFRVDAMPSNDSVPETVAISQDATITGANLPDDPFDTAGVDRIGNAETKTRYTIASQQGDVVLDDVDRTAVQGTNLTLDAPDGAIDLATNGGNAFEVFALTIQQPRAQDFTRPFELIAEESIFISSGFDGGLDEDDEVVSGDMRFAPGTLLRGNQISLFASDTTGTLLEPRSLDDLSVIDFSGLSVLLEGEDSSFVLAQDGALTDIPNVTTPLGEPTPVLVSLQSVRGDVSLVEGTAGTLGALNLAEAVQIVAGSIAHFELSDPADPDSEQERVGGTLRLEYDGLSDPTAALPNVETMQIEGRAIELVAPTTSVRVRGDQFVFTSPQRGNAAGLETIVFEQDGAFVTSDLAASELAQADQFPEVDESTVEYRLRSRTSGDFTVDDNLAEQLALFDVVLETPNGTITVEAATPGPNETVGTAPEFTAFEAIASSIVIDTPQFDTAFSQRYEGDITIASDAVLGSLVGGIVFAGPVDAASDGVQSLTVTSASDARFEENVGETARLANLTVRFADTSAFSTPTLEFGSTEDASDDDIDLGVRVDGDFEVYSVDVADFIEDRVATRLEARSPVPTIATVFKRSAGTLSIEADDIDIGAGEKLTTLGEAALTATGLDDDGTGLVRIGDVTALDRFAVTADRLEVHRRGAGSVARSDGILENDQGVDWVANDFLLDVPGGVAAIGAGSAPVVGTPRGVPVTTVQGELLPFSTAAIYPDQRPLQASDLLFVFDDAEATPLVLDIHPTGAPSTDISRVFFEPAPQPDVAVPIQHIRAEKLVFPELGIEARAPTGAESASRQRAGGIFDDASRAWGEDRSVTRVVAPRIDPEKAALATELFEEVLGPDLSRAPEIQAVLGSAVDDYRTHTGARRVLGFELRRFLRNRPSTQYAAYQLLEQLDQLFSAHRASGLVPGEFEPIQRRWVEAITPPGIEATELAQAIHPSRYVRGSNVLDVFGD